MNPEIFAKILKIVGKTGEKVVVIDSASNTPFVVMSLDAYERAMEGRLQANPGEDLTAGKGFGMIDPVRSRAHDGVASPFGTAHTATSNGIDPDLALARERNQTAPSEWGGDEAEEDRYYMEPAE